MHYVIQAKYLSIYMYYYSTSTARESINVMLCASSLDSGASDNVIGQVPYIEYIFINVFIWVLLIWDLFGMWIAVWLFYQLA